MIRRDPNPKRDPQHEIDDLEMMMYVYEVRINQKKIEIARRDGLIVNSFEDLKCKYHSNSSFEEAEEIGLLGDFLGVNKRYIYDKTTKLYICSECRTDTTQFIAEKTIAYDCKCCKGVVIGCPQKEDYCSPRDAWESLAGREGVIYHCKICNSRMGEHFWKYS